MNKNKKVVLRVSYNASKLARRLPKITSKLFSDIAEKTVDFLEKNTKKGLDINGNKFEPLSDATIKMRKKGFGSYETPISHSRPLIASKKMVSSIVKNLNPNQEGVKQSISIKGYGVFHNVERKKVPKRQWFGMSKYVFKKVVDNKKLHLFRKQVSAAFKKSSGR